MTPKILTFDIETAPIEGYFWRVGNKQRISIDDVTQDWTILSYTAKWLDQKRPFYSDTSGRNVRNDKALVLEIWKLLDTADIVVAQNGRKFDIRKVNARLLSHGIGPYSPVRVVDTYLAARKVADFTSHRLAWMASILSPETPKLDHREFPGMELWKECLKNNPKAWAAMKAYNIRDVIATENVYRKLLPWIQGHPNIGAYFDCDSPTCTNCGSTKLHHRGTSVTQQGTYARYQCQDCGKWSRGKTNLLTPEKRKVMLHHIQ